MKIVVAAIGVGILFSITGCGDTGLSRSAALTQIENTYQVREILQSGMRAQVETGYCAVRLYDDSSAFLKTGLLVKEKGPGGVYLKLTPAAEAMLRDSGAALSKEQPSKSCAGERWDVPMASAGELRISGITREGSLSKADFIFEWKPTKAGAFFISKPFYKEGYSHNNGIPSIDVGGGTAAFRLYDDGWRMEGFTREPS